MQQRHRPTRRLRWATGFAIAAAVVLFGCSSGDDSDGTDASVEEPDESGGGDETTTTGADASSSTVEETTTTTAPEGPAPGVTDDQIKVGINYVDTEALVAVNLDYELGDHVAVYQALIDDINDNGGIHGRMIEPVFAPIDPTNSEGADEACLTLTEDEEVFVITGFFLAEAVLCPIELHPTAVVGGDMTPDRLAKAAAPWVTWTPDTDQPEEAIRTLAERGDLDGTVAVYATANDAEDLENLVLPTLEELGIEPVATGLMEAPTDDLVALESDVNLIAERFKSEGADTIVLVGASAATWPQYLSDDSYRPTLLFLDVTAPRAFGTSADTSDTSVLDGSLSAGGYGPDQARYEEDAMQECVAVLDAAGVETPEPAGFDANDRSNQPYQAAFQACPDVALMRALLEAAGETLNYATLDGAIQGLEVAIPGDPTPRVYGPPPAADGNPTVYFFGWDSSAREFVADEG